MNFSATTIQGCVLIDVEPIHDLRGYFARLYSRDDFTAAGLKLEIAQTNWSFNEHRGTLRGMHYQTAPFEEIKVVQCVRGSMYDVVLDLRRHSTTFGLWRHFPLRPGLPQMLVIPQGCAHGYQTLEDHTEVLYHVSAPYSPPHAQGVRWNDPAFNIHWPLKNPIISERDQAFSDYRQ